MVKELVYKSQRIPGVPALKELHAYEKLDNQQPKGKLVQSNDFHVRCKIRAMAALEDR